MKICLVASSGGHLSEILRLEAVYRKHPHYFVLFHAPLAEDVAKKEKVWFVVNPYRKPLLYLHNAIHSLRAYLAERPDLIITTGAGMALWTVIIGRLMGSKIITIDSASHIVHPSSFTKVASLFSHLCIVQWKGLLHRYSNCVYGGLIPAQQSRKSGSHGTTIDCFVVVGSAVGYDFGRLIAAVDKLAGAGVIGSDSVAQVGDSSHVPRNLRWFRFLPPAKVEGYMSRAGIIITHAGVGTLKEALSHGKAVVVVPRQKRFGEAANDHQFEIAEAFEKMGLIATVVGDIAGLGDACRRARTFHPSSHLVEGRVLEIIGKFINRYIG